MPTNSSAIVRLACLQMVIIGYCILGVGLILRIRFGTPAPIMFATYLRDYGAILLLIPVAWSLQALVQSRPVPEAEDPPSVILGGVILAVVLAAFAVFGTMSAITPNSTLIAVRKHVPASTSSSPP